MFITLKMDETWRVKEVLKWFSYGYNSNNNNNDNVKNVSQNASTMLEIQKFNIQFNLVHRINLLNWFIDRRYHNDS